MDDIGGGFGAGGMGLDDDKDPDWKDLSSDSEDSEDEESTKKDAGTCTEEAAAGERAEQEATGRGAAPQGKAASD
ncbi:unnamed protein product [Prorocentrum cordatum]|uniref:FACT complex subunit n=1 Tax=Prorocentrum cordatum TaxID=2364126 RepID=A0ABN9XJX4_9DINO|nr:unnamed protein product [Polarella glacialis]